MGRLSLGNVRKVLMGVFALGLAYAGLRFALHGLDWPSFQVQLQQLDWRWLLLAVIFDIASYVAQGARWRFLLYGASLWQTTRAIYAGLFLNELIPLRPGEAVRALLASRDLNVRLLSVVPTMLVERLMDGLWLAVALVAALFLVPLPGFLVRGAELVVAIVCALLITAWLLGYSRSALVCKVRMGLGNVPALASSGCFLLAQGLAFWAVMRASHLPLGLFAAFFVMVIVRIGTMIPGAPANLGTHQFSTVLGLSLYGIRQPEAAGFSIVVFTVLTAPLLVLGFAACLSAGLTWQGVRRAAAPLPGGLHELST